MVIVLYIVMHFFILLSSPYPCVFDDNHVSRYMGAYDVVGGVGET